MPTNHTPSPALPLPSPPHNILLTIPRTASHLLTRLLNLPAQPSIATHPQNGYFFLPALKARYHNCLFTRATTFWTAAETSNMHEALATSFAAWERWVRGAQDAGKGTYVKEHVNWMVEPGVEGVFLHGPGKRGGGDDEGGVVRNPTAVPDEFWGRVRVTLLVRHPALVFASALRTAVDNEGVDVVLGDEGEAVMRWECTFRWHRMVYTFLVSGASGHEVIVVDAEDLCDVNLVKGYAVVVGLDPELVRFEWEAATEEEQEGLSRVEKRMKDTILESTGVVMGKLRKVDEIDLNVEMDGWRREFGDVLATRLMELVEAAMADYEWLRERKFTVNK
jgi:hypothetical protein